MPSCGPRPRTWTWRLTRAQILNAILAMWRSFFGQKLCKVGRKKQIDVASYGRDQSILCLDDSQFRHCNDRSVSKLKINLSISRDYCCDSVFDWHLGTKNGPQMIDLDNQKLFFGQNTAMVIPLDNFQLRYNIIKWPMPLGARPRSIKNVNKIL